MDAIKKKIRFIFILILVTSSPAFSDSEEGDKEAEIECVNSCGDTVQEWKDCAVKCYGDFMDESDHIFLACETDCVDKFFKPNVPEEELEDLEKCAEVCIEAYRGEWYMVTFFILITIFTININWESVVFLAERASAVIAGLTNGLLLHLIINKSPESFGIYKHLLTLTFSFETVYALINAMIVSTLFSDGSGYFIVIDSKKTLIPKQFMMLCSIIYCFMYGVSVAMCSILFIFRYFVMTGNKKMMKNKPHIIISWILPAFFFAVVFAFTFWFFCGPSNVNDRYIQ